MTAAAIAQKPPVVRCCVYCHIVIALSERGVHKAARNGVQIGELHGYCLEPWRKKEAVSQITMPVQGGDNNGRREFVRRYRSRR